MKFVKGIGLFFIYPLAMLAIGFYAGVETCHFFYPNPRLEREAEESYELPSASPVVRESMEVPDDCPDYDVAQVEWKVAAESGRASQALAEEAAASSETLCVDTEYVLEETDILDQSVVETTWRLPDKYVGMNREQFLEAMEQYEAFPPLSEMERGFVSLEVLSFSRERVVVQMNYRYVKPSSSFYLAVYDNEVVVYLEDQKTIYINTEIPLDSLPEALQQEIMQMLWIPNEESLYNFLENYSS